ncbi:acid phosphatase type 7-like isoform X2 [Corticium candelabrum]|uniref:acid phosphatase type 7-like isoform X2 n=1 Tax=Corticium candelabrum TaxID=121492 RepID=UPI002E26B5B1|nr:acid phosphatase type 7-like isoform X2 [Corticium candelabrum]
MIATSFMFCLLRLATGLVAPEQVHLSYGYLPSEMFVMWATDEEASSRVHVTLAPANMKSQWAVVEGECWNFSYGNPDGLQIIHRVNLTNLSPGQMYTYYAESNGKNSNLYNFTAMHVDRSWTPQFVFYGDMGTYGSDGPPIFSHLKKEVDNPETAAIFHVGDFAYDFDSDGGKNGDKFMNMIEVVAAKVPYMGTMGNHEIPHNYSHYLNRLTMPTPKSSRFWYSIDIGLIHFISYSTEIYFTNGPVSDQFTWLEQDLKKANSNREKQPWIIAFGHRPMYCSNYDSNDCSKVKSIIRTKLEPLFYEYGVDMVVQGHEHSYERLWPVYNETVTAKNYENPQAPVHIITGKAGCQEDYGLCTDPIFESGEKQVDWEWADKPASQPASHAGSQADRQTDK